MVENTSLSAILCCTASSADGDLPPWRAVDTRNPTPDRPVEDLLLEAAFLLHHPLDAGVGLLEDPGGGAHERRAHHREILDDLVHAAVHDGREADLDRHAQQHLAEHVRERQPQILEVVGSQNSQCVDDGRGVRPRRMRQPHALRFAGGPGRVDQRREMLGLDAIDAIAHGAGLLVEQIPAEVL